MIPSPASPDFGSMNASGEGAVPRQIQASPSPSLYSPTPTSCSPPQGLCLQSQISPQLPPNRVFSDRLVDAADMEAFVSILSDRLGSFFDLTFHNLCPNKRSPIFGEPEEVAPVGCRFLGDGLEEEAGHWGPGRKGPSGEAWGGPGIWNLPPLPMA